MARGISAIADPRTALAAAYTTYAWEARGSGYARTVTEEGWRLFRERLRQAEQIIVETEAEGLYDPHLAAVHLQVGKGLSWPERKHKRVFEEAVQREPCYPPYYFQRINWLLPRWQGQPGDSERFAEEAIALNTGCEGKGLYARLAVYLLAYKGKDKWFFDEYKFSWPLVQEGFAELETLYPDSLWNLNYHCSLACNARDWESATRLFERIGDRWDGSVWRNEGEYRRWKNWALNPDAAAAETHEHFRWPDWRPFARGAMIAVWAGVVVFATWRWRRARRRVTPPPLPPQYR